MSTIANRPEHTSSTPPLSDMAKLNATGLVVAAVGIAIQIVGGIDFPAVPPGLVVALIAGGQVVWQMRSRREGRA